MKNACFFFSRCKNEIKFFCSDCFFSFLQTRSSSSASSRINGSFSFSLSLFEHQFHPSLLCSKRRERRRDGARVRGPAPPRGPRGLRQELRSDPFDEVGRGRRERDAAEDAPLEPERVGERELMIFFNFRFRLRRRFLEQRPRQRLRLRALGLERRRGVPEPLWRRRSRRRRRCIRGAHFASDAFAELGKRRAVFLSKQTLNVGRERRITRRRRRRRRRR